MESMKNMNGQAVETRLVEDAGWESESGKKNMMKIYNRLRELPIDIRREEAFKNVVDLYGLSADFGKFKISITERFEYPEDYFAYYNTIVDSMIKDIMSSEAYERLAKDGNSIKTNTNMQIPRMLYKDENVGKTFISLDVRQGNYSALVHCAKKHSVEILAGVKPEYGWEKFVSHYTDIEYIRDNKFIREMVIGKINSKAVALYIKGTFLKMLGEMRNAGVLNNVIERAVALNTDEIVINTKDMPTEIRALYDYTQALNNLGQSLPLRFEYFKLGRALGTDGYIKRIWTDDKNTKDVIKCASRNNSLFIMRKLKGEQPTEEDKMFVVDGLLAKYVEVPEVEITFEPIQNV